MSLINAKQCIQIGNELGLKHGLWFEKAVFDSQFSFKDTKEGISAFIEKRKPLFKDN
jgi:enoyl-CoA hydratase